MSAELNTHFLSREELSHSATHAVWQFTNQDWGCFKPTLTTFNRELAGGVYFQLDSEKPAERFRDLFEQECGYSYGMDDRKAVIRAERLVDKWYGEDTFAHLSKSIDQSAMQFFNDVLEKQVVEQLGLTPPIMLQKIVKPKVIILKDHAGKLQLQIELNYNNIVAPDDTKNKNTPFDVKLQGNFRILNGGMQLIGIRLDGKDSDLARRFILGDKPKLSVMDKVRTTLISTAEQAKKHPLIALMLTSAVASLGLCTATQLGADIGPIEALARISGGSIREFLLVAATFTAAGTLSRLVQLGVESWCQRRGLLPKSAEILKKFKIRMKERLALRQLLKEDPVIASSLFGTTGESMNDSVTLSVRARAESFSSDSSRSDMSLTSDVSSPRADSVSSVEMSDYSSETASVGSSGADSPRSRGDIRSRRRCSDPRVDKLGALMQQMNKFDLDTAVTRLDPESGRSQSTPPALRRHVRHPRTDAPYGQTRSKARGAVVSRVRTEEHTSN